MTKVYVVTGFDTKFNDSIYGMYPTIELAEDRMNELDETTDVANTYCHVVELGKYGADLFITL